ncbi:hypothetical protein ACFSE1_16115 [Rhizobium helianthi]|uniref:Uncharacterized protein n=1 Tax=Rhizobium helianthi TaxID=1132695 RepID=A0ABW4M8F3_9HYPH
MSQLFNGRKSRSAENMKGAQTRRGLLFLVAAATWLALMVGDMLDARSYFGDVDDVLRKVQIQQLLAHGHWFDLTIQGVDMPGGYVSSWSRIVDLPYVILVKQFALALPEAQALHFSLALWPCVLGLLFCWTWVNTAVKLGGSQVKLRPIHIVAAFAIMPFSLWEFSPGRIDHHNVQLVALIVLCLGLATRSRTGGAIGGLCVVVSLCVGLELLPVIALLMLGLSLAWCFNLSNSRDLQLGFCLGLIIGLSLSPLSRGFDSLISAECDVFSAPFALALAGYAAITSLAVFYLAGCGPLVRLCLLIVSGSFLIAVIFAAYPACLNGPYGFIDPTVKSLWLDRVQQEKSVLEFYRDDELFKVILLIPLPIALLAALPFVLRRVREKDVVAALLWSAALSLTLLAIFQTRYIRFPAALTMLFLPIVWQELEEQKKLTAKLAGISAVSVVIAGLYGAWRFPVQPFRPDVVDYLSISFCKWSATQVKADIPPGRIIMPMGDGLMMLEQMPDGLTINAIPFHRSAEGMRLMYDFFAANDEGKRRAASEPFDYAAVCRAPILPSIPNDTVFAALGRGGSWPGLEPVLDDAARGLRVFRINHTKFR